MIVKFECFVLFDWVPNFQLTNKDDYLQKKVKMYTAIKMKIKRFAPNFHVNTGINHWN